MLRSRVMFRIRDWVMTENRFRVRSEVWAVV